MKVDNVRTPEPGKNASLGLSLPPTVLYSLPKFQPRQNCSTYPSLSFFFLMNLTLALGPTYKLSPHTSSSSLHSCFISSLRILTVLSSHSLEIQPFSRPSQHPIPQTKQAYTGHNLMPINDRVFLNRTSSASFMTFLAELRPR